MDKKKKELIIAGISLVILLLVTIGITYAFLTYSREGTNLNTITTGSLSFVYQEKDSSIELLDATPMSDEIGKTLSGEGKVFDFLIVSPRLNEAVYYEINATKEDDSTLPESVVKTYLTEVDEGTLDEAELQDPLNHQSVNLYSDLGNSRILEMKNAKVLYQEKIEANTPSYRKSFRLRMWIDEESSDAVGGHWIHTGKTFSMRVNVYANSSELPLPEAPSLEPNKPVLTDAMIPVVYDATDKVWKKVDINGNWYNYDHQEWANAVTVKENGTKSREEYMSAEAGTSVSMDDINTMWVWIPRYEYRYRQLGTDYAGGTGAQPGEIKIYFLKGTKTTSRDDTEYKVHPAFTFGSDELEGFWYAKFETGGTLSNTCRDEYCVIDNVVIKPSVTSLGGQYVSSFFYMARSLQVVGEKTFGFRKDDNIDIHMSKNSEWGAVAYLSQSRYGKYGNPDYEGVEKEVRINNCSNYITGIGANSQNEAESTSTCTTNTYETEKGMTASTTGNIFGIYDMSGGAWEYVMGVLADPSGKPRSGYQTSNNYHSGFTGMLENGSTYTGLPFPEAKYYNLYTSSSPTSDVGSLSEKACNGGICFGHALSETGAWYGDYYNSVSTSLPWLVRGGGTSHGASAGIFSSYGSYGNIRMYHSSRLVLTPYA